MAENQKQDVPQVGDIWQEVDPRRTRYVRIEADGDNHAFITTVVFSDHFSGWLIAKGSRLTRAALGRFDGKRGGYKLHKRTLETSNA
jgi:hypothetical protein